MHQQLERETKWMVDDGFVLPPLTDVVPGAHVAIDAVDLESVYYDTADHDLQAFGIVVRNRTGEDDTGWQVKVPADDGRLELHWPPADSMPEELVRLLAGVSLGKPLHSVTTIRTHRRRHRVDSAGALRFELADDGVRATNGAALLAWREVEVELAPGTATVPKRLRKRLKSSGARPSDYPSKLAHAIGGTPRKVSKAPSTVLSYLDEQIDQIIRGDLELRRSLDPIHDTRVAFRRIRSVLRVFDRRLTVDVATFDGELKWFAGVLGEVRDAQVQQERFAAALDRIAPELVLGPVRSRISSDLMAIELPARKAVDDAMISERYVEILNTLRQWRIDPPVVKNVSVGDLRDDARRASRKARRRLAGALDHDDAELLHGARKAAKRARYAAELVEPIDGQAARRRKGHKEVQSVLGDHQDTVVAKEVLRRLGATAGATPAENGFTFGILYGREDAIAAQCRAQARSLLN